MQLHSAYPRGLAVHCQLLRTSCSPVIYYGPQVQPPPFTACTRTRSSRCSLNILCAVAGNSGPNEQSTETITDGQHSRSRAPKASRTKVHAPETKGSLGSHSTSSESSSARSTTPSTAAAQSASTQAALILSDEQQRAVDEIMAGHNVFLTGCAGTGKSAVVNTARAALQEKYKSEYSSKVVMTAMTGIAAVLVEGVTLHSLLALGKVDTFAAFNRMKSGKGKGGFKKKNTQEIISALEVLFIDEASMLSAEMLQQLDYALTETRGIKRPFGGLQIILSGDLFQLPPIPNKPTRVKESDGIAAGYKPGGDNISTGPSINDPFYNRGYLFEAPVFSGYGDFRHVEFTKVYRQAQEHFIGLLSHIRCGTEQEAAAAQVQLYRHCRRELAPVDGIEPTVLYATNDNVDQLNKERMQALCTQEYKLKSADGARVTFEPPLEVYQDLMDSKQITISQRDHVLRAIHFAYMMSVEDNGEPQHSMHAEAVDAAFDELPSHLEQAGKLMRNKRMDWRNMAEQIIMEMAQLDGGLFKDGPVPESIGMKEDAQTMLLRNLDVDAGLVNGSRGVLVGWRKLDAGTKSALREDARAYGEHKDVERWCERNTHVPIVRFIKKGGNGTFEMTIPPVVYTTTLPGLGMAVRVQVPLKPAWALTVHKSQGATLDYAKVDISKMRYHGQLYTALSRVRSVEGMQIDGENENARKVDPIILDWHQALQQGQRFQPGALRPPRMYFPQYDMDYRSLLWSWEFRCEEIERSSNNAAKEYFKNRRN